MLDWNNGHIHLFFMLNAKKCKFNILFRIKKCNFIVLDLRISQYNIYGGVDYEKENI